MSPARDAAPLRHGMRPIPAGALVSKEEAAARLLAAARALDRTEEVALVEAHGRVAAREVRAGLDVPPFRRALMDGYAVSGEAPLRVVGDVFAGDVPAPLAPGTAVRIATGAPVPEGAVGVVRVEDTQETDGRVSFPVKRDGPFFEPAGADVREGEAVVAAGDVLTPARLGLLASVGLDRVVVRARPLVEVRSSGDELLRPGEAPRPGHIYDANATTLVALLTSAGAQARASADLPDDLDALRTALRSCTADLLVVSGGASAGERDLLADALRAEGEVLFHGVRVKPGKPLLAGRVGRTLVVGLPGNPTSALSNAAIFVLPALRQMAGLPPRSASVQARLRERVTGDAHRHLFLPVRIEEGVASPTFKGSSALTSLASSDGWIGIAEGATLEAGTTVEVHLW